MIFRKFEERPALLKSFNFSRVFDRFVNAYLREGFGNFFGAQMFGGSWNFCKVSGEEK